ncbi:prenyltransferase/squalene oxidase repeat-containing protein [Rubinisphaera margarita]|uniref:prenyltransferase/squalene oxidase repeat-containing protein n=1 Tax=Rubinisphaera margarita TaxID=2909586 RepID=UPI001EE934E5|nr:prenyltransferase/squalene oxidase repeat-containing protein [Rubinisphaera margarita]MCG6157236.1 squalene--hopene cyclase [Rubinisphaera margarita]
MSDATVTTTQDHDRAQAAFEICRDRLLAERTSTGYWEGELSTSALSTATAVMALLKVLEQNAVPSRVAEIRPLILGGLDWLVVARNEDGGWGDTQKSLSNISTTMLVRSVFAAALNSTMVDWAIETDSLADTDAYIARIGGVKAIRERYGSDRTFSVPILMQGALGEQVHWREVNQLPFELACLPADWYKRVNLPVVSYALPALIAIGLARHRQMPTWFLPLRWLRTAVKRKALSVLQRIQPTTGGYLEATPLTSFVTMALMAAGEHQHPVVPEAVRFLIDSVRPDGSWPIDTNLATWTTTLSVNALDDHLPESDVRPVLDWLIGQQYREVHPYTNADPGGWAWTDLPGGVPDADDTPGAILAVQRLRDRVSANERRRIDEACEAASGWLLSLQNSDGGWPTFCRGWGRLPFDRSSPDITAHVLRALQTVKPEAGEAIEKGYRFLDRRQRKDGAWLPLWFGNQYAQDDENPLYGTSRVLLAYASLEENRERKQRLQQGVAFLLSIQNADGGWGGAGGIESSVEETALALDALIPCRADATAIQRGVDWLAERAETGTIDHATPIGFYFAKLWYYEKLYPLIFATSALRKAVSVE